MTDLSMATFEAFHAAVQGHAPSPWLVQVAGRLARREAGAVDLPADLGPAALLEAAVWAAGHGAWRRIVHVRDRHLAVDPVQAHAQHLQAVLPDELQVADLRGSVHGDDDWVLYPERLTVALATVDALGSRLMFRGLGVSPSRWPLHAAFFSDDTLVLVDAADRTAPFVQTLGALREAGAGIDVLSYASTELAHEPAQAPAARPCRRISLDGVGAAAVKAVCGRAREALASDDARRVALVVDRLALARQCVDRLTREGVRCALLTGRSRPAARDAAWTASVNEAAVIVTTQGIAVDADLAIVLASETRSTAAATDATEAASLLPIHLELLAQTGVGAPELDLTAFLHGPVDRASEVSLVWRDDLLPHAADTWSRAAQLLPPMQRESLSLPTATVRRWLAGRPDPDLDDRDGQARDESGVDETGVDDPDAAPDRPTARLVLRWRGPQACEPVTARQIRPGDTLMVPAAYGGCDRWGWAPGSAEPVEDLADRVMLEPGTRHRTVARLVDGHGAAWGLHGAALAQRTHTLRALEHRADAPGADVGDALVATRQALLAAARASGHPLLDRTNEVQIEPHPHGIVLRGPGVDDIEGAFETGRATTLDQHHRDVARCAARLAHRHPQRDAIVQAAALHDAGKAEPRLQQLLHGHPLAAAAGPARARSARRRRADQLAAWRDAPLPRGFRHEFASLPPGTPASPAAGPDSRLVRHLVASHHGHARPWGPRCEDAAAPGADLVSLGRHRAREWAGLLDAFGPWRLAQMEWLLRAADARAAIDEVATPGPAGPDAAGGIADEPR
ncbi:hypothetical protein ACWA7J_16655 [Leptothrix sp. BB-4]